MSESRLTHPPRLHALDALRAFALLLGVAFHAIASFTGFGDAAVKDSSTSVIAGMLFFLSHVFRMSLFFFLAGFFARLLYHRRGAVGFWLDRAKRILTPLVLGVLLMTPLLAMLWSWGARVDGRQLSISGYGLAAISPTTFPLAHLWFLYYLLLLYASILTLRWAFVNVVDRGGTIRARIDEQVARVHGTRWAPLLLGLPLTLCFAGIPGLMSFGGIPTPHSSLIPQWPAMIGYGTAFAWGWLVQRQPETLQSLTTAYKFHFSGALALSIVSFVAAALGSGQVVDLFSAVSYSTAIWCWNFALIGLALKYFSSAGARARYVADASYWIYLVHLPLVVALQIVVARWNWHWSFKYLLMLAVAYPLLLLSYHYLVRFTIVGVVLNGRRQSRSPAASSAAIVISTPTLR